MNKIHYNKMKLNKIKIEVKEERINVNVNYQCHIDQPFFLLDPFE